MSSSVSFTWEVSLIGLSLTLFTLLHIFTKPRKHKSDLILFIWLVLLNIPLLHNVLAHLDLNSSTLDLYSNPTLNLLHGPILYLYVRILSGQEAVLNKIEFLHLIPTLVCYLLFISVPHEGKMVPSVDQARPVSDNGGAVSLLEPLLAHFGFLNGIVFIVYSVATVYTLMKHQNNISEVFSQNDNRLNLKWLFALPATFLIIVILNFVNENALDAAYVIDPITFHMMSFLTFIILLCFFGVKQKPVFLFKELEREHAQATEDRAENSTEEENDKETSSSENNLLSDEATAQLIDEMHIYMVREKPYLDPDFSVYSLAEALNMPRRVLSQVLNNGLSKNFYQYVNEFRIDEVKATLHDQANKQSTILDIAFQSGFKSKSSFNSLFKQYSGVTPSQYRKTINQ